MLLYPEGLARIYVNNNPALSDFIKNFMFLQKEGQKLENMNYYVSFG